ncbi:ribosomal L7Ae/L30e/S12e/Gadd45 family protein [Staphylococcus chromogenes]|uniref:ribosomal L7Ae/L30e/S12e/Gadd45 family protein n=1 Tax=Staphylococcus chromogenes TaxID=46126 RepID=UPI000D025EC5|nr:ribosomal L7Ae/L30e/S12e/Gadd45 family protein [Staphylococcus chromogenes]MDT0692779.1 ribosomal L7Ae/L30e/S12e/Gadd45 family protein [Staphylococcus chromogenes]MDT0699199.1 ribosomal L7Ae/L30e/S12e/Gadd45 family protein [Staphylococcus chromogenes]PTF70681.1 50S ribosomal protein L7ae-like protein [Staphylococcus chromogenes]PTF72502.1 50S ribosomal protein L7ae-like protein [Staphylococcus chromogenes]PTF77271.1 50S ribosomal protein L7ae-like protein [Staphylococcus chromogenes]
MSNEKVTRLNKQTYVVGLKQTLKALKNHNVSQLIIGEDVNVHLLARVLSFANQNNIPITFCESQAALGEQVGINVKATVVALLK